ncbi:MAG: PD-(D/E)XK nuclease family protein [Eubacteriaceae bacterium]|nr:PD-(D/E)XK nuclease family protein [Eubacteriaceae bacterium]
MKIITGRQGSGKTEALYEMIRSLPEDANAVLVVPAQYTYVAERALLSLFGSRASSRIAVLSLKRLAARLFEEAGHTHIKRLSSRAQEILLKYAIDINRDRLAAFGAVAAKKGFADNVMELLEELGKNSIDVCELTADPSRVFPPMLTRKLHDISVIAESMRSLVGDQAVDDAEYLSLCAEAASSSPMIRDCYFFFDDFHIFDKSDYVFLTAIISGAKDAVFTLTVSEEDFFSVTKETLEELTSCAAAAGVPLVIEDMGEKKGSSPGIRCVEKLLAGDVSAQALPAQDSVRLTQTDSIASETLFVASSIRRLLKDEGYRLSDIGVVAGDMALYRQSLEDAFEQYGIPFFLDVRRPISHMPPVRAFLFLLEASLSGRTGDVRAFARTGFIPLDRGMVDELDNYLLKHGINYLPDRPFEASAGESPEYMEMINSAAQAVAAPINAIKKKVAGAGSVGEYCRGIYGFLEEYRFYDRIMAYCEELTMDGDIETSSVCAGIYNEIISVLECLYDFFGEEDIGSAEIVELITYALSRADVGIIPTVTDKVFVGDVMRSRFPAIRAMFVLGANEGMLPSAGISAAILTDKEKHVMAENGLKLMSTAEYRRANENFSIYTLMSKPEEKLVITRSEGESETGAFVSSAVFDLLEAAFGSDRGEMDVPDRLSSAVSAFNALGVYLKEKEQGKADPVMDALNEVFREEESLKGYAAVLDIGAAFDNAAVIEDIPAYQSLIGMPMVSSVSIIETYADCPFMYFSKYVLGLKQREEFAVEAVDMGNVLHKVVEEYEKLLLSGDITLDGDIAAISDEICSRVISGYRTGIYSKIAYSGYTVSKLKDISRRVLAVISRQMKGSSFALAESEGYFGEGGRHDAIRVDGIYGPSFLRGKIDRVDEKAAGDGRSVVVIDYKSSVKNFSEDDVISGSAVQLPVYLSALASSGDTPAGMLYMPLNPGYTEIKKSKDNIDAENAQQARFAMSGVTLAGEDGSYPGGRAVTAEEMREIIDEAQESVSLYCSRILSGNIEIAPKEGSRNGPCRYCEYRPFCKYSEEFSGNGSFSGKGRRS